MSKAQEKIKEELKNFAVRAGYENFDELEEICSTNTVMQMYKILNKQEKVTEEEYSQTIARILEVPYLDLDTFSFTKEHIDIIAEDIAYKYTVFPISQTSDSIKIAISDPFDLLIMDDLKMRINSDVEIVISEESKIKSALEKLYKEQEDFLGKIEEEVEDTLVPDDFVESDDENLDDADQAPIVKVVDLIISESLLQRVSDIHIEPLKESLRVRYRVDGVLKPVHNLPKKNQNAVLSRLKIMSGLNITESRIPQDGRFKIRTKHKEVDFRVSSLPTRYGEKFVLRALDKSNLNVGLESAGFSEIPLKLFNIALSKPFGIMLVTGPTGSGKSTTLYSVLNRLNTPDKHIITIEDPVEYQVDGMTQIPINHEINMTFSSALRSVLRQSPDVVMVGEIRDSETADIAIKASLTGQFILSTLHTNDSIGAITRLIDMGVEPFLLASSIVMTSAQRLCRRICENCKITYDVPDAIYEKMGISKDIKLYIGKGCEKCGGSGYHGREAVLEVLLIDEAMRDLIVRRASEKVIESYARENLSFRTLREDVMEKCLRGITTVEEVFRITT